MPIAWLLLTPAVQVFGSAVSLPFTSLSRPGEGRHMDMLATVAAVLAFVVCIIVASCEINALKMRVWRLEEHVRRLDGDGR